MPSDLWKTSFQMEVLQNVTKINSTDKCNKCQKMCQNTTQIHEKLTPEINKKWCLKTNLKKQKLPKKWLPNRSPKNKGISRVAPLGAPLVAQTAFVPQKWAPALPKYFQWSKNEPSMTPKSPLIVRKSSKSQAFRSKAWRTARSACNSWPSIG